MIETLRRRFILTAAVAVAIVLLVIAGIINISNLLRIANRADELVSIISDNDGHFPKENDKADKNAERKLPPMLSPETPFSTRFFTVKLGEDGNIVSVDTGKISASTDQALAYAKRILEQNKSSGFIESYRFAVAPKDDGALLVFVDCSQDLQAFSSFLINSIWVCLLGLATVVALLVLISKRAIAPVAESYEKQKQFITNAGHELKTPLAIISANAEVLELEHGESEWSASIKRQVDRLTMLVNGLVSLSRMDETHNELQTANFSLSEAVSKTAAPFIPLAESLGKALTLQIKDGLFCCGNEDSLCMLVSILLDNAVKYASPKGEIMLSLQRRGKYLILETSNPAQGLREGDYKVLFERFYRGEGSRSRETGGYGIGLAVGKAIVTKHKGALSAFSPDGQHILITAMLP